MLELALRHMCVSCIFLLWRVLLFFSQMSSFAFVADRACSVFYDSLLFARQCISELKIFKYIDLKSNSSFATATHVEIELKV